MDKTLKKRMIAVILSVLAVLLLLAVTVNLLTRCESGLLGPDEASAPKSEIKFSDEYVTDEEELRKDERYLGYDKTIHYYDPRTGVTVGIENGDYKDYGECVERLADLIAVMMAGDADGYNAFFSDLYFESNEPQGAFSMQKIYDIKVSPYSEEEKKTADGGSYTEYIYALDYKIRKNNGTLRPDLASDGIRTQYILITDREGELLIDRILTP